MSMFWKAYQGVIFRKDGIEGKHFGRSDDPSLPMSGGGVAIDGGVINGDLLPPGIQAEEGSSVVTFHWTNPQHYLHLQNTRIRPHLVTIHYKTMNMFNKL